jgi:uncharacterized protein YjdB
MRRHTWSGVTVAVALSLVAVACGEKGVSAPGTTSTSTPGTGAVQVALTRKADTISVDQSLQLTAIIPPIPGSVAPTTVWTSSDSNVAIVTQTGVLFALRSGRTTITVTTRGYSDATTVTVKPSIRDVEFDADSFAISLSESVKIPYRVLDSDGNPVDLSLHKVEWVSTAPDVVPLTGDATVTGRSIGRSDLLLRVDNKIATAGVKVLAKPVGSVSVSPASLAVVAAQQAQLTATTLDVHGDPLTGRNLSWSSSDANIATVSSSGLVTGVAAGQANVTANAEGRKAVVPVTVMAPTSSNVVSAPVATVAVTLNASTLLAGQSTQANATLKDATGAVLTGRTIAWTTSDATIATVSATGLVTALRGGLATIKATSEEKSGSAALTAASTTTTIAPVATVTLSVASSVNVGQSVQATATLKDSVGNVLTGRTITWVSSDANIASVSTTGLVTGVTGGAVTITASAEGKSASAVVTSVAPKPAVHMITLTASSTTITIGELTQVTAVPKDVNGTPITGLTITWSSSPSAVATVSSSGMVAGLSAGSALVYAKADSVTRSIGITVIDTASTTTTAPTTPTTPTGTGGTGTLNGIATLAELPRLSVNTAYPTAARQVRVAAGANLQVAIGAAQPGDELLLAPGATYVGNFYLPDKGATTSWITIRTDVSDAAIGAAGTRMTPTRAASANLAKILSPNNAAAIATTLTSHHWRLTGLEIGGTAAAQEINGIVRFGDGSSVQNSLALVAHDLVLDRAYVHGLSTQAVRSCVSLQSATSAVVDSWISDCHSNNGDSQAIVGWNGPGPYLIKNNHMEGGHQGLFFGGADPFITNLSPSDITVQGNHITRPLSWKGTWQTKTIIETKNARRMLMEGNVIENVWPDAQAGYALLLKSENQSGTAPWSQSTDITVRYNIIRNVASGINLAASPGWATTVPAARLTVVDNSITNLAAPYGGDGIPLQILGGIYDGIIAHNSWSNAGNQAISFDGGATTRLVIHSNVLPNGAYGVKGSGTGTGTSTLSVYAPGGIFAYVTMVGADCTSYPATTTCPSSIPSSLPLGYDARTVGANMSQVNAATAGVVVAP